MVDDWSQIQALWDNALEDALRSSTAIGTQGENAVESEGKIAYDYRDDDFLSMENRAEPNPRSSINWVYKAKIFSVVENKLFHQKISEINQGSQAFEQNEIGEYMLPIKNKIVFTDGDYDAPYVSKVIEVMTDSSTRFEFAKEVVFDVEKGRQGIREAARALELLFEKERIVFYKNNDNGAYGWADRKRKGKNRRTVVERYQRLQNGRRDDSESEGTESVKYSDRQYLDAVESGDMETAQRMVDEAAEKAMPNSLIRDENGKLLTVYHGSPGKFTVFNHNKMNINGNAHGRVFYFTEKKSLAEGYQKDGGQLLKGYLNITNPMSEEKVTIKKSDLVKYIKATCEQEARNLVADGSYDSINDALPDTWISNYVYTYGMNLNQAYKEVADIIYSNDNDVDIVAEISNVAGTEIALKKAYEVLGYDGVIYTNDRGTHEYVALISNQFKSAESVTYDDNGNIIPLSERFDESKEDIRYSLRREFISEYDNWDKKDPSIKFNVGTTSKILMKLGVPNRTIFWDSSKIIKIKTNHPEMTDTVIKQVPEILENPIIVMKSKSDSTRLTMFGEIFANGKPVLAVLVLNPTNRKGIALDTLKIASAYGKDNAQNFINSSEILYVDKNKKRVSRWNKLTRLQLPVGLTNANSTDSISQNDKNVNADIQFSLRGEQVNSNALAKQLKKEYSSSISVAEIQECIDYVASLQNDILSNKDYEEVWNRVLELSKAILKTSNELDIENQAKAEELKELKDYFKGKTSNGIPIYPLLIFHIVYCFFIFLMVY